MLDAHFGFLLISFKLANQQRDKGIECSFKDREPSYPLTRNRWVNLPRKKGQTWGWGGGVSALLGSHPAAEAAY